MITNIEATTIESAWFQALRATTDANYAFRYRIQRGSFDGDGNYTDALTRHQLYGLSICITHPATRPLAPLPPLGLPPTTSDENIEKYFATKLFNADVPRNTDYTYGEFIVPRLLDIADMLTETPHTNHAVIQIGEPFRTYDNPPCLRLIQWIYDGERIHLHTFWRSWDLYAGLPENLGGMQILNEYMSQATGIDTGTLNAYSSGAHAYWEIAGDLICALVNTKPEKVSDAFKLNYRVTPPMGEY